jgi:hypothetical protein
MPSRSLLVLSLAAMLAAACGGDDDGSTDTPTFDASFDFPDSGEVCTDYAALDLGALDPIPGAEAVEDPQMDNPDAKVLRLTGVAANGTNPDVIQIELWDGLGAFDGGVVATGTYPIEGDETSVVTCGVCIYLAADATLIDGTIVDDAKRYIATGGSLTVDSITTNFTGSATGLTFTEIDWADPNAGPLAGGCTSAVPSATFDVAIQ